MRRLPAAFLLLLLSLLLPSGCSYVSTVGSQAGYAVRQAGTPRQRGHKHMLGRETFFVFGRVLRQPMTASGRLAVVALSDQWSANEVVDVNWFSRGDSYFGLNLPSGEYRLVVALDRNGDRTVDETEVIGGRRVTVDAAAAPDLVLGDCDLDLGRRVALGSTRFRAMAPATAAEATEESLFFPRGTIRSLDDPIFAPAMANLGMYRPREFLERAPMMFYALEEDSGYKVPVVFVHGIGGSPRDFAPLVERLDRTRFKPWFFFYPSGQDLGQVAAMFHRIFLSGRVIPLEEMPLVVVAHSMGGVVVREAMNRCSGRAGETHVARLITIASPLGGHPGARFAKHAPVVIPSWRNLDPGGEFIGRLHRRPLPAETAYHLYTAIGEQPAAVEAEQTDGVVPVVTQRSAPACREATEQLAFADSHVGVLRNAAVADRICALLAEVRSPFPEAHLRVLWRGGYELPAEAASGYTPLERFLVRTIGRYMDALADGRLQPVHPAQEHFVAYCRGLVPAKFPVEPAWSKLCRDLPDRCRE